MDVNIEGGVICVGFRVGDRVRLAEKGVKTWNADAEGVVLRSDSQGTVVEPSTSKGYVGVRFDGCGDDTWPMNADEIETIVTDDNDEIIALLRSRLVKGREAYGVGVSVEDGHDWEIEALEEVLDGMIYVTARLIELRRKRGDAKC